VNGIAEHLRAARRASGLTLRELSAQSAVSPGALCQYERGQREPRISTVVALARALGFVVTVGPDGVLVERTDARR
jgi:transcriptional regulator with XRE-family HTH domain